MTAFTSPTQIKPKPLTKVVKVFKNGASQAVRLPDEFRFDQAEIFATLDTETGNVILSRKPTSHSLWDDFFADENLNEKNITLISKKDCDSKTKEIKKIIKLKRNEISQLTVNLKKLHIQRKKIDYEELKVFKEKVLESLTNSGIDKESLDIINSRKSIHSLKFYLTNGLNKKYRGNLVSHNIDYLFKEKKEKKNKKNKVYYSRSRVSIKPIYTPMGNKR